MRCQHPWSKWDCEPDTLDGLGIGRIPSSKILSTSKTLSKLRFLFYGFDSWDSSSVSPRMRLVLLKRQSRAEPVYLWYSTRAGFSFPSIHALFFLGPCDARSTHGQQGIWACEL